MDVSSAALLAVRRWEWEVVGVRVGRDVRGAGGQGRDEGRKLEHARGG